MCAINGLARDARRPDHHLLVSAGGHCKRLATIVASVTAYGELVMTIPTEAVGSVPRSPELQAAMGAHAAGTMDDAEFESVLDAAVAETIGRLEATGSPVLSDGEQTKSSFVTYPLDGMTTLSPEGVEIPFDDGHTRQLPVLTAGPFEYQNLAGSYVERARKFTDRPLKQAVIAASAMGLLYPQSGIEGYSQEQFISDLVDQSAADIRSCFDAGAQSVQVDFSEDGSP